MKHLTYSASGTARWKTCPASAHASKDLPPSEDEHDYTAEGNLCHSAAEQALTTGSFQLADPELREAVQLYIDEVDSIRSGFSIIEEFVERFFPHTQYPDFGGTADWAGIYKDHDKLCLHVVDLKAGVGLPVDVLGNQQLLSYCCAIGSYYPMPFDLYRMTVVQPRCDAVEDVQFWEVGPGVIEQHLASVVEAFGSREFHPGEHCRWCPVVARCEALRMHMLSVMETSTESRIEKLLQIHDMAGAINHAIKEIGKALVEAAKQGTEIPGHKTVEKRSNRKWAADDLEVIQQLKRLGLPVSQLTDISLKSPAQVEKMLPKADREHVAELVDQIVIGHKVVPENSRGRPVSFGTTNDFDPIP